MTITDGQILKIAQEINMPDSVIAINIFYLNADFVAPQTDDDVVLACESYIEGLFANVSGQVTDLIDLGDMAVYVYNSVLDQWDNIGSETPAVTFTNATDMLPHGVCGMVRAYSVNTRSIARKYLAGFCEDQQENGTWLAAAITAMANFGNSWTTRETISVDNDLEPAVFSQALRTGYRLTGVEVVLSEPAYQRRRRPGVGT